MNFIIGGIQRQITELLQNLIRTNLKLFSQSQMIRFLYCSISMFFFLSEWHFSLTFKKIVRQQISAKDHSHEGGGVQQVHFVNCSTAETIVKRNLCV